ncbi:tetratricopeptide repeat protein [Haliovirga abyssi]|uniref:Tetratricopeptide repeat protein n=1 Tax=Haliovirga abyssi TaxID=2996794 RepID=A0AAU9DVI2_9FUSO|nr:tetratricopeptide repeat protein [Haliovirga abyssi]BDU50176.1 hypothetical protein HLVA_07450 [Haliovirga abyssi]
MKKLKKIIIIFLFFSSVIYAEDITVDDYLNLGDAYYKENNLKEAKDLYDRALEIDSSNITVVMKILKIYETNKKYDDELKFLENFLSNNVDKNNSEIYFKIADIYNNYKKNKKKAYEYYEKFLNSSGSNNSERIFYIGDVYFKDFLYEKAMNTFLLDKTGNYKNEFGAAITLRFLGYYKKSILYYKKVIKQKPNFLEAYLGIGISYQLNSDFDNAIKYFLKYISEKKDEQVYIELVKLYMIKKNDKKAKTIGQEGLNFFPNSKELRDLMLTIYSN